MTLTISDLRQGRCAAGTPRRAMGLGAQFLLLALCALFACEASAHRQGESYLYLRVYENRIDGRFEVGLKDFNAALGLTGTGRQITRSNIEEHIDFLKQYYLQHVTISDEQGPLTIRFKPHRMFGGEEGFVLLPFALVERATASNRLTIDYSLLFDEEPSHRGFLIIEHNWATGTFANEAGISLVFSPDDRRQDWDVTSSDRLRGFIGVVKLGVEHIWMGLDHVMFLLALLLPAVLRRADGRWERVGSFRPALVNVLLIVTVFTVAHSVTLTLAALGLVHLPGRLVESAIALSIAVAAADILFPILHRWVLFVVFGFGLFHGFGFAGVLEEMGILGEHLGLSLFGFNLGVEIGQVVIVALVFPVLYVLSNLRLYRMPGVQAAAVVMICVASVWLYERIFEVDVAMTELALRLVPGAGS
jgi:hypothetical protein